MSADQCYRDAIFQRTSNRNLKRGWAVFALVLFRFFHKGASSRLFFPVLSAISRRWLAPFEKIIKFTARFSLGQNKGWANGFSENYLRVYIHYFTPKQILIDVRPLKYTVMTFELASFTQALSTFEHLNRNVAIRRQ